MEFTTLYSISVRHQLLQVSNRQTSPEREEKEVLQKSQVRTGVKVKRNGVFVGKITRTIYNNLYIYRNFLCI